ncbi:MAG: metallophosphoesterase, partial [Bryobacteraceae bacterium]
MDAVLGPLREDLRQRAEAEIALVVVSGDFTDRGEPAGFDVAGQFLRRLQAEIAIPWDRFIVCPGNHDVQEVDGLFDLRAKAGRGEEIVERFADDVCRVRVLSKYPGRFTRYRSLCADLLALHLDDHLSTAHLFADLGVQVLALNTAHRID